MSVAAWAEAELAELRAAGLHREPRVFAGVGGKILDGRGRELLSFAGNDYLDLARHPRVIAAARAALETHGAGAASSRLVAGTLTLHEELEARLAAHKGYPAALVLGSGYVANVALPAALVGRGDAIFADRLAHASLLDGALQSRARLYRFRHNDAEHLRELLRAAASDAGHPARRRLVLTESVFSMDGDLAPLAELAAVAEAAQAMLVVDEAHSAGIFGPSGGGLVRALGLAERVTIAMSTLSKALGSYGGVLACSAALREWLVQRHRGFIYSTALPPAALGAALGALDVLAAEPERGARLLALAADFRNRLRAAGLDTGDSASAIVPVIIGDKGRVMAIAARLLEAGIVAAAIREPTVPAGTSRLRLSVTLAHSRADLERAADLIIAAVGEARAT